ncbi:MAG TPA: glycosyltransferase [Chthoniobacterales bacterium]|nr:glycosyltransferase [Chthoniobacterales bacterium]
MKNILILTAGYGEGHNSAARGIRDGLRKIAPNDVHVELHDLFADTYGIVNDWVRTLYMGMINRTPRVWGVIYRWLDRQTDFVGDFRIFFPLKSYLRKLLARLQPDVIVSVYPAYPHILDEMFGRGGASQHKRVVVVTDSISVNAMWYQCSADYFLLPNEVSADVLLHAGVPAEKVKTFGFPVSPVFAQLGEPRPEPSDENGRRVLYIINSANTSAPELVRRLAHLPDIQLTVTVGRNAGLKVSVEKIRRTVTQEFETVAWSDELPRLLRANHLVISKAGGATVQEAMCAGCPVIVNHVIPGQEEGNARYIMETNSGTIALTHDAVIAALENAFANDAAQWREWAANISQLGKPNASLDIANFLLSL